jgi:hypothetical protein
MRRFTGQFTAHDARGKAYTINVYTTYTPTLALNGPPMNIEGPREFELMNGAPVIQMGKGQYEIAATGVGLRSDEPDAS